MKKQKTKKNQKKGGIKIAIADFEVASENHSLEELEACINRLIDKNKDFASLRRQKILYESQGMFG